MLKEKKEYIIQRLKWQFLHYKDVRKILKTFEKKVPSDKIADMLITFLSDENEKIRNAAINTVEIAYSYGNVKNLEKKLLQSLKTEDNRLKKSVLKVFINTDIGPVREIEKNLNDKDPEVQILAAKALSEIKDPVVVPSLAKHLQNNHEKVREAVKTALLSISWSMDERCLEAYIDLFKMPGKGVRDITIACIQNIQNENKLSLLKKSLKHTNSHMRIGSAAALAKIARYSMKEDIITAYLSEADEIVKIKLGKILKGIGSTAAVNFLGRQQGDQHLNIEEIFNECLNSINMIPDLSKRLPYLIKIAYQYIHTGKRNKALSLLDEMYELIINEKKENKTPGFIALIHTYSEILKGPKLNQILEEALQAAENTANRLLAAEYCAELGDHSIKIGKQSTALLLFNQAYKLSYQKRKEHLNRQIILWTKIAGGFVSMGEDDRGFEMLDRCKKEATSVFFEDHYSTTIFIETISHICLGFANAGKIKEAISLADGINEPEYDGILHAEIGIVMCQSGMKKKAFHLFNRATKIARNLYNASSIAGAFLKLSKHFISIDVPQKSEDLLTKVLYIIDHDFEKTEVQYKTELLGKCTEISLSLNNILKALLITDMISDATTKTKALLNIAYMYHTNKQYKKVRRILDLCKETVIRILRSRDQAPLLVKIGILYNKLGDRDMTTRLIQRAYQLAVYNRKKELILAELAPLLVNVTI